VLVLVAAALAAPPATQLTSRGFAVGVAATGQAGEELLTDPDCVEGGACEAIRHHSGWGGQLTLQVAPFVMGWVEGGTDEVKAPALEYEAAGFRVNGGVLGIVRPKQELGGLGWANVDYATSGNDSAAHAHRWVANVGGGARFGRPDALLTSWVGAEVVVSGEDVTSTLTGALDVPMQPTVPFNVVAGFQLFSAPLAGPGSDAPLLFLSCAGSAGSQLGVRFSLGAAL